MSLRLVPNSVTSNDLERRNSPNSCVILPHLVAFWADHVKVVKDYGYFLWQKCSPRNVIFSGRYITYGDIGRESPLARAKI